MVVVALLLLAALFRTIYFVQLSSGPCLYQHRWNLTDMNFFDSWARRIDAGDLLTNGAVHPMHDWHRSVAEEYFKIRPEQEKVLLDQWRGAGERPSAATLLWDRWCGQKTFYQEPLYPYMLAAVYKVLGHDVRWVFLWQMLLSLGGVLLVYLLARRYFGDLVAAIAGTLVVLCGPLLYYDMLLLRESMIGTAGLLLVYLTERARERPAVRRWLALGAAFGFAILLKSYLLLLLAALLGYVLKTSRRAPRTLARRGGALVGGVLVVLSPVIARNLIVGVNPLALAGGGPVTFVCNNTPDCPPDRGFFHGDAYIARIMDKSGGRIIPSVVETLKAYDSPGTYVGKLAAKFAAVWHWYETPNNANFYYYRLHAGVLRWLPVTFWLIGPLALVGMALAACRAGRCWPLYALVAANLCVLVAFTVFSRLRAPLLAPLAIFAALTAAQLLRWIGERRVLRTVGLTALVAALGLWTGRPLPRDRPMIRAIDYITPYTVYWMAEINGADASGDHARAVSLLEQSLRFEPDSVKRFGPGSHAVTADDMDLATFYARVHRAYGQALLRVGRSEESEAQLRRADELVAASSP